MNVRCILVMCTLLMSMFLVPSAFHPGLAQPPAPDRDNVSPKGQSANKAAGSTSSAKDRVILGLDLEVIAPDRPGNIWVGGSIFGLQGLLLRHDLHETTALTLPKVSSVNDLIFTGLYTGWMIADYKRLHRTTDAGVTWQASAIEDARFSSVCFLNGEEGWVAGDDGAIYHTANGGSSWNRQASGTDHDLDQILFVDAFHGWAIGGKLVRPYLETDAVLLATTDGGNTWRSVKLPTRFKRLTFVNSRLGWGLSDGNLFHTGDGGKTWKLQREGRMSSISFLNESEGWVVGVEVLHTKDGGQTWLRINHSELASRLEHVVFTDSSRGWAISSEAIPKLVRTVDGGKNWKPVPDEWREKTVDQVYRTKFGQKKGKKGQQ